MGLLSVGAAVHDVGVGEARAPHHDTAKAGMALVFTHKAGQLVGCDVVRRAARSTVSRQGGCGHADEYLGVG